MQTFQLKMAVKLMHINNHVFEYVFSFEVVEITNISQINH